MISIIIPAYNAEKTIGRCVQSVLAQTFQDWEMILVDDGSQDGTLEKCKSFHDARIRIAHKDNGGVSSARNYGMRLAKGEYVAFVDSDDYIECDYLQNLYKGIGHDLVITGFCYENKPEDSSIQLDLCNKEEVGNKLSCLISADQLCFPWGRLFKRSIIEKHNIRFDENMRFAEDNVFNWEYLCHAETLYIDTTNKDYHKTSDVDGKGYCLSLEEMDYIDGRLFELSKMLESHYGVPLCLDSKQLMHVLFLGDMLQLTVSQWYEYYKKYHPSGTEKEGYDFVTQTIYYMTLVSLSKTTDKCKQKELLARLDDFIDKPFAMLTKSSIKTRFLIPFIKMRMNCVVLMMVNKLIVKSLSFTKTEY